MAKKKPKDIKVQLIPREDDKGETRQPYAIMDRLIGEHHSHLADAKVALAWKYGNKADTDGRLVLGQCRKASDLDRELHAFDFVILLNWEAWNAADWTVQQMEALIDHELCHAQIAVDEESGEEKRDSRGRPVWRIRKHDVEEFNEIVARHGLWKGDLAKFAAEAIKTKDGGALFKGDAETPITREISRTMSPEFAKAAKGLVPKDGSVTISTNIPGVKSVTIDQSNKDRFLANCDAAIAGKIGKEQPQRKAK